MSYFVIEKSKVNSQFYFRFNAANHEQILSGESYVSKQGCQGGIDAVKRLAPNDSNYRRSDVAGNYRFNIVSGNNEIVAESSEGYVARASREHAIGIVKRDAPTAPVYDRS